MNIGFSLGSNLDDRLRNLQSARDYLVSFASDPHHRQSSIYDTLPVDCAPATASYLNAVVEIEFRGTVRELFKKTQSYEVAHGRGEQRATGINAPRTIDMDILYAGSHLIADPDLVVPHPRLALRAFVLKPLAEIHPELVIPGIQSTVRQLLEQLPQADDEVKLVRRDW